MKTQYCYIDSRVGRIWVAWCDEGLVSVGFADQRKGARIDPDWEYNAQLRCDAIDQLHAYFAGTLRKFDLPLVIRGTDFQKRVWRELARIPFGHPLPTAPRRASGCPWVQGRSSSPLP